MNLVIALALLAAQPPEGAPGESAKEIGRASDIRATVAFIMELEENHLKVHESWTLENDSGKQIPKQELIFPLPATATRLGLDESTRGFVVAGNSLVATEAMGAGQRTVAAHYLMDKDGGRALMRRSIPVDLAGARLIIEAIDGLSLSASVSHEHRATELNGLAFHVYMLGPVPAGSTLEVALDGLPSRTFWPRRLAVLACLACLAWMVRALMSKMAAARTRVLGPLSAEARRDRILKAIEILDAQLGDEKISEKRHARRREELMRELASVLREIELLAAAAHDADRAGARTA